MHRTQLRGSGDLVFFSQHLIKRIFRLPVVIFIVVFILFFIIHLYVTLLRPWQLRWGATNEEIRRPMPGDEIVITENNQPVARLVPATVQPPRKLGTMKGTVTYMAPDFDAPLGAFKEYMP